jgi:hypothetical protein
MTTGDDPAVGGTDSRTNGATNTMGFVHRMWRTEQDRDSTECGFIHLSLQLERVMWHRRKLYSASWDQKGF